MTLSVALFMVALAVPNPAPEVTCQAYFVTAYMPNNDAEPQWDRAPVQTQVWWENDGKRKYPRVCWTERAAAKEKGISPIWILSWNAETVTEKRPNPLDIVQAINHPLIYNPGPPIEVTGHFFSITMQQAEKQEDGSFKVGRAVFTKSVGASKDKSAFEAAVKEMAKRNKQK